MKKLFLFATLSMLFVVSACELTQDGKMMDVTADALNSPKMDEQTAEPKAAWGNLVSNPLNAYVTSSLSMSMFNGTTPYVAYADGNGTNFTLSIKACNGGSACTSWTTVGSNISADEAYDISMDVYDNGGTANPYVVYRELVNFTPLTFKPAVKMCSGVGSCGNVGNITALLGPTVPFDWYPQIAVYDDNGVAVPFVVANRRVMYYNGTNWAYFGPILPAPLTGYPKIGVYDDNGTPVPYAAYHDAYAPNNDQITVVKYNYTTSDWEFVGSRGFTFNGDPADRAGNVMFYLTAAGTPYVFFTYSSSGVAVVKKFDGANWVNVANNVATAAVSHLAITVDETNNDVYVAYHDMNNSDRLVVKKSVGGTANWAAVGGTISSGWANYSQIGVDTATHVPIACYEDHSLSGIYVKKYQ